MGFVNAFARLHIGGKYSDLTLTCNYRQWSVHKAIVCSRSGFFDGACSHPFHEAASGVIDLSDDDVDAVEQMIHFFYYLDYLDEQPNQVPSAMFRHRAYRTSRRTISRKLDLSNIEDPLLAQVGFYASPRSPSPADSASGKLPRSPSTRASTPPSEVSAAGLESGDDVQEEWNGEQLESTESESHLLLHTRVYALAEKYDIPSLKQLARRKFEMAMACYYDSPEFADAIEEVYGSTVDSDRGLRDIVLQAFRTHPQLATTQDVYAVIKNTPSLAMELFRLERGLPI